jgi:hypothetical protein
MTKNSKRGESMTTSKQLFSNFSVETLVELDCNSDEIELIFSAIKHLRGEHYCNHVALSTRLTLLAYDLYNREQQKVKAKFGEFYIAKPIFDTDTIDTTSNFVARLAQHVLGFDKFKALCQRSVVCRNCNVKSDSTDYNCFECYYSTRVMLDMFNADLM